MHYRIFRPINGPYRGWLWRVHTEHEVVLDGHARTWTTARDMCLEVIDMAKQ